VIHLPAENVDSAVANSAAVAIYGIDEMHDLCSSVPIIRFFTSPPRRNHVAGTHDCVDLGQRHFEYK
jgi:hypothetical protein